MEKICDGNRDQHKFNYLQISQSASGKIWIGATDEKKENEWTDTHGKALTFTNWNDGEPNNGPWWQSEDEHCVYTNEDGKPLWNDKYCYNNEVKNYACQYGK